MSSTGNVEDAAIAGVFVQTNEPEENRVVAFRRDADGTLDPLGSHPTGGAGNGGPHLTSQGSVVLTRRRPTPARHQRGQRRRQRLRRRRGRLSSSQTVPRAEPRRRASPSTTGLVYVLNTGESVAGRLPSRPRRPRAARRIAARSSPPTPTRPRSASRPTALRSSSPSAARTRSRVFPSTMPACSASRRADPVLRPDAVRLRVHERRDARRDRGVRRPERQGRRVVLRGSTARSIDPVSRSVGNGRSEICWAVVTRRRPLRVHDQLRRRRRVALRDRRRRRPHLEDAVAGTAVDGQTGLRDEDLSPTAASSTRSTPTPAASSAGPSSGRGRARADRLVGRPARNRRRARGELTPTDAPRTSLPRDVHHARELERRPRRRAGHRGPALPDRRGSRRRAPLGSPAGPRTTRADGSTAPSLPDFRGVLETDDGATVLFSWHGYAARRDGGARRLSGTITHLTDDERYRRLNDVVCPLTGEVRPRADGGGFEVVIDVAELIWEPAFGPSGDAKDTASALKSAESQPTDEVAELM